MEDKDLKEIIKLRTHLIDVYDALDGKNTPFSQISQEKVAYELVEAIKIIDNILKDKVEFK